MQKLPVSDGFVFLRVPAKPLSMFVGQMILTQGLRLMDLGCGAML